MTTAASDVFLAGIGVDLPEIVDVAWAVEQGLYDAAEAEKSGLLGVAVAGDRVSAPEMGLAAGRRAAQCAGIDPTSVNLLLYADCYGAGPEGWLPQFYLQRHLVGGQALALGIRQDCNGVIGALEMAGGYLHARPERETAMIVASDNYSSPEIDRWTCARPTLVLADGASALVISKTQGFARVAALATVTLPEFEAMHRGSKPMVPASTELDFGRRLEEFIAAGVEETLWMSYLTEPPKLVERLLDEAGIGLPDVAKVLCFNASREFLETGFLDLLDIPLSRTTWDFGRRIGHVGPSDHVISLEHALASGEVGPGDHVLLFGMAPGMTLTGGILEILDVPPSLR